MPSLKGRLESIRPALAAAVQRVLNEWQPDESGFDPVLGTGGACDEVTDAMVDVICDFVDGVTVLEGGHEGDDHAWLIVVDDRDAVGVDVPPSVYETGGGYSWTKIEGAEVEPSDVMLFSLIREDVVDRLASILTHWDV